MRDTAQTEARSGGKRQKRKGKKGFLLGRKEWKGMNGKREELLFANHGCFLPKLFSPTFGLSGVKARL
jgi:hypothetical protein